MEKIDYFGAIKIPLIVTFILACLVYAETYYFYKDITAYSQVSSLLLPTVLASIPLVILGYANLLFTGWRMVSRYKGAVVNALYAGLIVGGVQAVLSFVNMTLIYITIPGYRIGLSPPESLGTVGIVAFFAGMIVGMPFSIGLAGGLAGLGGLIAKQTGQKKPLAPARRKTA